LPSPDACSVRFEDTRSANIYKVESKHLGAWLNVSNHPVSSNSNEESVQNCSHDLIVHRLWHTPYLPPVQRSTSEYKWGCGSIPRKAHMKTCPDCNGDGVVEKGTGDEQQCPTCGGSGFVPDDDDGQEDVIHTK